MWDANLLRHISVTSNRLFYATAQSSVGESVKGTEVKEQNFAFRFLPETNNLTGVCFPRGNKQPLQGDSDRSHFPQLTWCYKQDLWPALEPLGCSWCADTLHMRVGDVSLL